MAVAGSHEHQVACPQLPLSTVDQMPPLPGLHPKDFGEVMVVGWALRRRDMHLGEMAEFARLKKITQRKHNAGIP